MKELVDLKMVEDVIWVPTKEQLADGLTKRGANIDWLLRVCHSNRILSDRLANEG